MYQTNFFLPAALAAAKPVAEVDWRSRSVGIRSKGSTAPKARRLAELSGRRQIHQGQFFTPLWVAWGIWHLISPAIGEALSRNEGARVAVLDNSVGSGVMFSGANPESIELYGNDVDEGCVNALAQDAQEAGFRYVLEPVGLEQIACRRMGIALINPPFGLNIQSPLLAPLPCTTYGRFGPNTGAVSHLYALEQAMEAAPLVIALLPVSAREHCLSSPRLRAELRLPASTFQEEGANVQTALYVFGAKGSKAPPVFADIYPDRPWPAIGGLQTRSTLDAEPIFKAGDVDTGSPTITLPVTGSPLVTVHHKGRRLVLRFECGLTQAKVMNGLLREPVAQPDGHLRHRYPAEIRFAGDGRFFLDAYLLQEDADRAFDVLLDDIRSFGGRPLVSATLKGYWKKLKRRHVRASTPFRHTAKVATVDDLKVTARRGMLLEQHNIQSPVIKPGEYLRVFPRAGEYVVEKDGYQVTYRRDQLQQLFEFVEGQDERAHCAWKVIHEGLVEAFPAIALSWARRLAAAGVDWLWPYQLQAALELLMKPYAGIAGWKPGTGKARLAVALALMSPGPALIAVEAGLLDEMIKEISESIRLDPSRWQLLADKHPPAMLRQVNVITYSRLKSPLVSGTAKTLAHTLRRRFSWVIADEGSILSNPDSQQSRALLRLAPGRLYVLDGTPISNYPRDILPLAAATVGGGRAHQPYDIRSGLCLEARLLKSTHYAQRGIDAFRERHVVLDWATHQFNDSLRQGAKREIPKIANLPQFRDWVSCFVQRRLRNEPEVAPYAGCPEPDPFVTTLKWDQAHFAHYLSVSVGWASWFRAYKARAEQEGKSVNFIAVLARLRAVIRAANQPHESSKEGAPSYHPLTSKQRYILGRVSSLVEEGHKVIVYASSPALLKRLSARLRESHIDSCLFTGQDTPKRRMQLLDSQFRYGPRAVLSASLGVTQRGLNIPQATYVLLANRDWSADTEEQAISRVLRPDQTLQVPVEYVHLRGSIDEYMSQLVSWKSSASAAGLDWGDGATESDVYVHMDAILEQFCVDILGARAHELYDRLCNAAA